MDMTTDLGLIEFWEDYLFIVTVSGSIIGGRLCNDSDPKSLRNNNNIILRLADENGIAVEGDDLDTLARKIIKSKGSAGYYVFNNYVLAVNPDNNKLGVYSLCDNIKGLMWEAMHEAGFIVSPDWNGRQGRINFIKYLQRMRSYADQQLLILDKNTTSRLRLTKTEQRVVEDYRIFGRQGVLTFLIGYANNGKVKDESLSRVISRIVNTTEDCSSGRYRIFDLAKDVTNLEQFWEYLFVLTDYSAFTYIFTNVGQVQNGYLQDFVIYMMKREEYRPSCIYNMPMVDFSQLNIILINRVGSHDDTIPAYVRGKSLQIYIENI